MELVVLINESVRFNVPPIRTPFLLHSREVTFEFVSDSTAKSLRHNVSGRLKKDPGTGSALTMTVSNAKQLEVEDTLRMYTINESVTKTLGFRMESKTTP